MNTEQAAEYIGVHVQTLKRWRQEGYGPEYRRVGRRKIVYDREALDRFLDDGRERPGSA